MGFRVPNLLQHYENCRIILRARTHRWHGSRATVAFGFLHGDSQTQTCAFEAILLQPSAFEAFRAATQNLSAVSVAAGFHTQVKRQPVHTFETKNCPLYE